VNRVLGATLALVPLVLLTPRRAEATCSGDAACSGGPARIMLILDASSPMLNVGGSAGSEGSTDWDQIREVLAATGESLYDTEVEPAGPVASQVVHFGLIVFGDDASPGEQKIVVDYGPCTEPNLRWALDPWTSCDDPGCTDPWAGPPIEWTYKDGSQIDPPNFALETISHVPQCAGAGPGCDGSGRFTHLGIELASANQLAYSTTSPFLADDSTLYVNILVTDGVYDSSDAEVQAALEGAFDDGITTYVVGFGAEAGMPAFGTQLDAMAAWGSGGSIAAYEAGNLGELQNALADIIGSLDLPCCATIDCSEVGGADGGGGTDGAAADWGSADGGGTADAGGGTDGADAAGIDDDGGCTCTTGERSASPAWGLGLLALLGWRRRREQRRAAGVTRRGR
jgi:MYXO-CTERM domain-containing protein